VLKCKVEYGIVLLGQCFTREVSELSIQYFMGCMSAKAGVFIV